MIANSRTRKQTARDREQLTTATRERLAAYRAKKAGVNYTDLPEDGKEPYRVEAIEIMKIVGGF